MEWTAAVAAGQWLLERLDSPWRGTIHDVVPRGFDAYARVFHTARRVRPVGRAWPPLPYGEHRREWAAFEAVGPEFDDEPLTWNEAAQAMRTRMHPLAQWHALVAPGVVVAGEGGSEDADGWRYQEPSMGQLEPEQLAAVARVLASDTSTPDAGYVAVWEGWGGLLGHMGPTPSRAFLQVTDDGRHRRLLGNLVPENFRSPFAKDRWQPGILSDEISRGPRLRLANRGHVLFTGGISELASSDWVLRAPWRDREAEAHGLEPTAEGPSLVWPNDRAWVLVSEVDWDSSVVAGSEALVAALCDDPTLEAHPIPAGAVLGADSV